MIKKHSVSPDNPLAVVVIIHGMAEHKERYFRFMKYLSTYGYASVITDIRGHGYSENKDNLGWFGKNGKELVIQDSIGQIEDARKAFPGLKLFLLGHSMGAMVARMTIKQRPDLIDGVFISGNPSYNPSTPAGIALTRVMALFRGDRYRSKMVTGLMFGECIRRFKDEPYHNAWLTTSSQDVKNYDEDPLCGFKFTLNGYRTVMQIMYESYSSKGWAPAKENLPIHFASGADDPFMGDETRFNKAVELVRSHGYGNVSSKIYDGMRHEILNETKRMMVWTDVKNLFDSWLQ